MIYPNPLTLCAGEVVTVVANDAQWPAYVWCTNGQGLGGWVPESYLEIRGDAGQARRDYDARELTVDMGEILVLLDEEGGWYWAENGCGERGWVPKNHLELIAMTG